MDIEQSIIVRAASGGVVTVPYRIGNHVTVMDRETIFTDPDTFAIFMRSWFTAHHGEKPVVQLPRSSPNREG
jgi:hypothetical protein